MVRSLTREWSAQISAAATGRKPLFHENVGESAPQIANALRPFLPDSVDVRATATDIFVYRPSEILRLADPERPLWDQVKAHANDGHWLGYGANYPGEPTVGVQILDPAGNMVSGFRGPIDAPEKFADARALDFTLATGKNHTVNIIRD